MELSKLRSMPLSTFSEVKPHIPGWYEGRLASYSMEDRKPKDEDKDTYVEVVLNFTAENPLNGQPMENVSVNRRYPMRVRIYKEEDTSRLIGIGKTLRPDVLSPIELREKGEDGGNIESYLEGMINSAARVLIVESDWHKKNRDISVLEVQSVRKAA